MKKKKEIKKEVKEINTRVDFTADIEVMETKGLGHGEIEVLVSNSGLDRHGERIMVDGIDIKQVKKNPVVLWGHDYTSLPIGKITKIWKDAGNLMAKIKLATDTYEFANTVYNMIIEGFVNAVSIGGIVKEWNPEDFSIINKLEMLELSIVPIGAHPDALVTSKALGLDPDMFKKQYEDFLKGELVDKMKVLPQNEIEQLIKGLETLTLALRSAYTAESKQPDEAKRIVVTVPKQVDKERLMRVKLTAKQIDKQSELILAAVKSQLDK